MEAFKPLPIPIQGQVINYVGPSPARPGTVIVADGTTTNYGMVPFTPKLLELGLKGMIGKEKCSKGVQNAIRKNKAAYMVPIGGADALVA